MHQFQEQFSKRLQFVEMIEPSKRLAAAIEELESLTIKTTVSLALVKANVVRECRVLSGMATNPRAKRELKKCEQEVLLQLSSATRTSDNVIQLDDYRFPPSSD